MLVPCPGCEGPPHKRLVSSHDLKCARCKLDLRRECPSCHQGASIFDANCSNCKQPFAEPAIEVARFTGLPAVPKAKNPRFGLPWWAIGIIALAILCIYGLDRGILGYFS